MLRPIVCAVLLGVTTTPGRTWAQAEPEAAAMAFGNALKANDWAAAARLMYPEALHQLRGLFEPLVAAPGGNQIALQLFGVQSAAELATTPDTVLFANFLRVMVTREAGLAEALRTASITQFGHVPAGGDTVLVVGRTTLNIDGVIVSQFEVMPFVRADGRWWGLLKADFTNMAAMLQNAMGRRDS